MNAKHIISFVAIFLLFIYLNYVNPAEYFELEEMFYVPIFFGVIIGLLMDWNILLCSFCVWVFIWICFLNVNPYKLEDTTKIGIMKYVPSEYRPSQQKLLSDTDIEALTYPVVIKPVYCAKEAIGVYLVDTKEDMYDILETKGINPKDYMVQTFLADYPLECGIMFEKMPLAKEGKIIYISEKMGTDKIRPTCDPYCTERGEYITPELEATINAIAAQIPHFNAGRFDVRFNNADDLKKGKNFKILEVNGVMGMDGRKHIAETNREAYLIVLRWLLVRIFYGLTNIISFNGYAPHTLIRVMFKTMYKAGACSDWEDLYGSYA